MAFVRDAAVAAVPPWNPAQPAPVVGALADYVRFYGLDRVAPAAAVRHGIGYLDGAGYRVVLQSWRHPEGGARGTVLVLHGYYDHVGIFDHVIERLLADGHDVLAFDLPGHGLSSGEPAAINEFSEYQTVLQAVIGTMSGSPAPAPWQLVAQSTGGAIVMTHLLAARAEPCPFAGAVLLAPLVRPVHWRMNSLIHALVSPFAAAIARKFAINSHDDAFLKFLREDDPLQARMLSVRWVTALKRWIPWLEAQAPVDFPLTVIQGDEDGTVDWRHNLDVIRQKFPRATVHLIPQGRHQLANEAPEFRTQVLDRMTAALAAAAPAADAATRIDRGAR